MCSLRSFRGFLSRTAAVKELVYTPVVCRLGEGRKEQVLPPPGTSSAASAEPVWVVYQRNLVETHTALNMETGQPIIVHSPFYTYDSGTRYVGPQMVKVTPRHTLARAAVAAATRKSPFAASPAPSATNSGGSSASAAAAAAAVATAMATASPPSLFAPPPGMPELPPLPPLPSLSGGSGSGLTPPVSLPHSTGSWPINSLPFTPLLSSSGPGLGSSSGGAGAGAGGSNGSGSAFHATGSPQALPAVDPRLLYYIQQPFQPLQAAYHHNQPLPATATSGGAVGAASLLDMHLPHPESDVLINHALVGQIMHPNAAAAAAGPAPAQPQQSTSSGGSSVIILGSNSGGGAASSSAAAGGAGGAGAQAAASAAAASAALPTVKAEPLSPVSYVYSGAAAQAVATGASAPMFLKRRSSGSNSTDSNAILTSIQSHAAALNASSAPTHHSTGSGSAAFSTLPLPPLDALGT
jgi:hypothetical protein